MKEELDGIIYKIKNLGDRGVDSMLEFMVDLYGWEHPLVKAINDPANGHLAKQLLEAQVASWEANKIELELQISMVESQLKRESAPRINTWNNSDTDFDEPS